MVVLSKTSILWIFMGHHHLLTHLEFRRSSMEACEQVRKLFTAENSLEIQAQT